MTNVYAGPPYFFLCKRCGHGFRRDIKFGLLCPKCRSLRVSRTPFPCK